MDNKTSLPAGSSPAPRASGRRDDEDGGDRAAAFKALTREEVLALRAANPPLNPWRVVAAQAVVGAGAALLGLLLTFEPAVAWSALYGALCVVVPGALMARGMTSRLTSLTPMVSAAGVLVWEMVKIAATVALLAGAPRFVDRLSWPALLAGLVVCLSVYAFALLWRGGAQAGAGSDSRADGHLVS